jgi:type IV secretion system protein TrbJ
MRLGRRGFLSFFVLGRLPLSRLKAQLFGFGGATEWTQLANMGQLISANSTLLKQFLTMMQTYQQILIAGQRLSQMQWTDAMSDMMNVFDVVNIGQGMAFDLANMDRQFRENYPGFANSTPDLTPYYQRYEKWAQMNLDTVRGTLRGVGVSYQQLRNESAYRQYLQSQSTSAVGQMQALQISNQVGVATLDSLAKLRQILLLDLRSKQTFQAMQAQRDIGRHQAEDRFYKPAKAPRDGIAF